MLTAWIRFSDRLANSANDERDQAPEDGEAFGGDDVMRVVASRLDEMPIEIDGGGGGQRIQFRGFGRKRGGEKGGDEQADQAVREIIEDESDEDVIGFVGFVPFG